MTTYRAAYWIAPNGQSDIRLTRPEHQRLDDEAMRAEARAEAIRTGLIGDDADANQITEAQFFDGLRIGQYTE